MKHSQLSGAIAETPAGKVINDLFSVRAHVTQGFRGEQQVGPVIDPVESDVARRNRERRHRARP
jgi:hypothetical protein